MSHEHKVCLLFIISKSDTLYESQSCGRSRAFRLSRKFPLASFSLWALENVFIVIFHPWMCIFSFSLEACSLILKFRCQRIQIIGLSRVSQRVAPVSYLVPRNCGYFRWSDFIEKERLLLEQRHHQKPIFSSDQLASELIVFQCLRTFIHINDSLTMSSTRQHRNQFLLITLCKCKPGFDEVKQTCNKLKLYLLNEGKKSIWVCRISLSSYII